MLYLQTGRTVQAADVPLEAGVADAVPLMLNSAREFEVVSLLTDRLADFVRCKHFPSPEGAITY